eukprot:5414583-Prymnesium_polylepis.1
MCSSIAQRSYVRPSSAVTGSSGSSKVMGQIQTSAIESSAERNFFICSSVVASSWRGALGRHAEATWAGAARGVIFEEQREQSSFES